ncbi:UNVERIFIED_CONTAM: hypothetical protein FKN15_076108 [Acipenser sinensis]
MACEAFSIMGSAIQAEQEMCMCDRERMNPSQQSPSQSVRALYNRISVPHTGWFGSSFQGQSEVGHPGRRRSYNTRSHWRIRDCTRYRRGVTKGISGCDEAICSVVMVLQKDQEGVKANREFTCCILSV